MRPFSAESVANNMDPNTPDTNNWPDLAIGLYDKLTGRGAEITYDLHNFEVHIPSSTASNAQHAVWLINGMIKIRTNDDTTPATSHWFRLGCCARPAQSDSLRVGI